MDIPEAPAIAVSAGTDPIEVRLERERDASPIHALNRAAFPTAAEARLVDRLRAQARPFVSLVAELEDAIVGHIAFSPVVLDGGATFPVAGLAPMAVAQPRRRAGIGTALVRHGLARCRALGFGAVCVLGYPDYYARFGFEPASGFGIESQYDVPDDVFMMLELRPQALDGCSGRLRYHAAFDAL